MGNTNALAQFEVVKLNNRGERGGERERDDDDAKANLLVDVNFVRHMET